MGHATSSYIVLKELAGNPPPELNTIQKILAPHSVALAHMWIALWVATALVLVYRVAREYNDEHHGRH